MLLLQLFKLLLIFTLKCNKLPSKLFNKLAPFKCVVLQLLFSETKVVPDEVVQKVVLEVVLIVEFTELQHFTVDNTVHDNALQSHLPSMYCNTCGCFCCLSTINCSVQELFTDTLVFIGKTDANDIVALCCDKTKLYLKYFEPLELLEFSCIVLFHTKNT